MESFENAVKFIAKKLKRLEVSFLLKYFGFSARIFVTENHNESLVFQIFPRLSYLVCLKKKISKVLGRVSSQKNADFV